MKNPEYLYIGTCVSGIREFEPRQGRHRGLDEGKVIFASPDKALATVFTIKGHNDSWMEIGYFNDILVVVICANLEKFVEDHRNASVYCVPADTFECNLTKGMGQYEWTSRVPVRPLSETRCDSSLEAMLNEGVQVYFVDEQTFAQISQAPDHGFSIIQGLKSENARTSKNVKVLT